MPSRSNARRWKSTARADRLGCDGEHEAVEVDLVLRRREQAPHCRPAGQVARRLRNRQRRRACRSGAAPGRERSAGQRGGAGREERAAAEPVFVAGHRPMIASGDRRAQAPVTRAVTR